MSKTNKKAPIAFKDASAKLVKQVEGVIAEAKKHTFSVSRVFAAYNEVFNLQETPQTCASCLRSRAEKLTSWYNAANGVKQLVPDGPVLVTVDADGNLSGTPDFPVTYIIVDNEEHFAVEADGVTLSRVIFTPAEEGAQYGIATYGDGVTPAPAFVYKQDEKAFAVSGDAGNYTEVTGEPVADTDKGAAFLAATEAHFAKLAELGVTDESTDVEVLEALEILNADENATDEERAFIAARIEGVQDKIAANDLSGVTTLHLADPAATQPIFFSTDDKSVAVVGSKGTVKNADGSNVKTGTHDLADGTKLAVAVGGRATIK